jgi:leucyl-tRNA synthetase
MVKNDEPAKRLFTQGMVIASGAKMSKSKGNVVGADDVASRYGTDTARMFVLFAAPPEKDVDWRQEGVEGIARFLGRVYRFATRNIEKAQAARAGESTEADKKVLRKLHQTIRKVTEDFESRWHFNTSLAVIMELINELYAREQELSGCALAQVLENLTLLLAPFAPYLAQELWEEQGRSTPVFREPWPQFDPELAKEDLAEVVIQVNGKLRSRLHVPFGTSKADLEALALADEKVKPFLAGKQIVKVVVVPDKLVNIVVR